MFLKVVKIDPVQANADLQLGRLAIRRKAPAEALGYLDRCPRPSGTAVTRKCAHAGPIRFEPDRQGGRHSHSTGRFAHRVMHRWVIRSRQSLWQGPGNMKRPKNCFPARSQPIPTILDVLYNLGLAASHAGHNERAREVLEAALRQRPLETSRSCSDLAAV